MATRLPLAGEARSVRATGAPIAAKGFRPFFLLAAAFAAAIIPLWLLALRGVIHPGGALDPITWHAHEMVFGFAVAVIAGFLLTAVGNWTARETAVGPWLLALAGLWLAGRVALLAGPALPARLVAAVDLAFLPALAVALGRPIVQTKNHRNLVMIVVLAALWLCNLVIHLDGLGVLPGLRRRGSLVAVDVVVAVILIMAGRIFPMFTRNATRVESIASTPALDVAALLSFAAVIAADAADLAAPALPVVLALAAALAAARTLRWGARHSLPHPLLWILHVGYLWIPLGLALRAASSLTARVPPSAGTHALTAGAIGGLTLGMMARVSLGHTGRPLVAPRAVVAAFYAITAAALLRVFTPIAAPSLYPASLQLAGALWTFAFAAYLVTYAPMHFAPRPDGKAG
jgi:uncharacterized protein involved in response to NO